MGFCGKYDADDDDDDVKAPDATVTHRTAFIVLSEKNGRICPQPWSGVESDRKCTTKSRRSRSAWELGKQSLESRALLSALTDNDGISSPQ